MMRATIGHETDPMHAVDRVLGPGPDAARAAAARAQLKAALQAQAAPVYYDVLPDSLLGRVFLAAGAHGLLAVGLATGEARFVQRIVEQVGSRPARSPQHLQEARRQLQAYLRGERSVLEVEVDLSGVSPFHRAVLEAARRIPRGSVVSYGEMARRLHRPRAGRAVGQALARNPVPVVIPCHRVVSGDGRLQGYLGDRIGLKAKLLKLEGVPMAGDRIAVGGGRGS
ncbi:MAG: methylated-DNA--[protein]-cysteine S-methyltransferase [Chloroflexi bacterium]|nr:methylated-DNA--[protein]-cysteine S-methyltransferase [Chloroflexota bacterium]